MTMLMDAPARPVTSRAPNVSAKEIIAKARTAPASALAAFCASASTGLLLWASFTPLDFGPLAWVALIPLLALVKATRPARRFYTMIYLGALCFWLPALQWMRLGHETMHLAWLGLASVMAIYIPVLVALSRVAVHRFKIPLTIAVPVIWTGLELLRGHLFTGFGWYLLGHTQYRWIEMIQISDIVGAYGVGFVVAMMNALFVDLIPLSLLSSVRLLPANWRNEHTLPELTLRGQLSRAAVTLAVFAACLGYGFWRTSGGKFEPGPRVALIQGNFPATVEYSPKDFGPVYERYNGLTGMAVREQPDLIVWPEGMFPYALIDFSKVADEESRRNLPPGLMTPQRLEEQKRIHGALGKLSQMAGGASLILGASTVTVNPTSADVYNSAILVGPQGMTQKYDKLHRVVFGEYIPLKDFFPFLQSMTPYRGDFGIKQGAGTVAFNVKGFSCVPVICFEDTVPHLVRTMVSNHSKPGADGKPQRVDLLVNISNDGWFHGSSEHDQHLITAAFRAVECRTPMVRAVNTGISAVIDGDGVIRSRVKDRRGSSASKEVEGVLVETVPLDSRTSLYVLGGDWFAQLCLACVGFLVCVPVWDYVQRRRNSAAIAPATA